jgi:hypothetical protein
MANEPKKAPAPATSAPASAPAKARKARKPVDPNETPDARFMRIGRKRVTVAVKSIQRVAQLGKSKARKDGNGNWRRNKDGSTSGYAYTEAQADKLIQYLTDAVAAAKTALAPRQAMKAGQELLDL